MITRFTWTLALLLCSLLPLAAQAQSGSSFEGAVTFSFSDPNEKAAGTVQMYIRGAQTAMKFDAKYDNGPSGVVVPPMKMDVLLNTEKKSLILISDAAGKPTAVEIPVPGNAVKSFNGTVQPTDETKTIAGYACKKYVLIDAGQNFTYWVTADLSINAGDLFSVFGANNPFARLQNAGVKGMPLRIEQSIDGREPIVYEATAVSTQKLDAAVFAVPAGVQVQSVMDAVKITTEEQK